jgi:hypothetical protein
LDGPAKSIPALIPDLDEFAAGALRAVAKTLDCSDTFAFAALGQHSGRMLLHVLA